MQAMVEREDRYVLGGEVQVDDAYLGGELSGGTAGRGSKNKVPFLAAVSVDADGHPIHAKLSPVSGFTPKAVAAWASAHLAPCSVLQRRRLRRAIVLRRRLRRPRRAPTCGSRQTQATRPARLPPGQHRLGQRRPASPGPITPSTSASTPSATSAPSPTVSTGASSWTRLRNASWACCKPFHLPIKAEANYMKNISAHLIALSIIVVCGCSSESLKRIGYETLQNIKEQQCQKDLTSECPERESYENYQSTRKEAEGSK
jgi:hypothetical protein